MDHKTLFPILETGFSNLVIMNIPVLNSINDVLLN